MTQQVLKDDGIISYYYTRDHLGSVRELTNSSGTIVARYDYDPYGRTTVITGTVQSDFQYAGYYEHATSGLNLTLFRAYDPNTARWLSRDPLPDAEMSQGPNLYEYVANNPVLHNDPDGRNLVALGIIVVGTGIIVGYNDADARAYIGELAHLNPCHTYAASTGLTAIFGLYLHGDPHSLAWAATSDANGNVTISLATVKPAVPGA